MKRIQVRNTSKSFTIGFEKKQSALGRAISFFSGREPQKTIQVLDYVNLEVESGEIVGIIGANGSGKSTLLRIIAGIYPDFEGSVEISGKVVSLITVGVGLKERLTMKENIFLMGALFGLSHAQIHQRFDNIVEFSELAEFASTKLYQFSAGMLQRLAFSIAVHAGPDILLLDEVFEVGDAHFRQKSREKLKAMAAAGASILLVSHNVELLEAFASRIIRMEGGNANRVRRVLECPNNAFIPRQADAGKIIGNTQTMHNGLRIARGSYYPELIEEMLVKNKGVHEPQEEKMFMEVLKKLPAGATMLELGAYWAFYSMWFRKEVPGAVNYLVEPDAANLEYGKKNFELNGMKGNFIEGRVGKGFLSVDGIMQQQGIKHVDVLHADIQGAELEMLHGAKQSIAEGKINYVFLSTHSQKLHLDCLRFLKKHGFFILFSADYEKETYSYDGIIVAKRSEYFSQLGQDKWILQQTDFKRQGYFVDIGAHDGKEISNTYVLEKEFGWRGICAEPAASYADLVRNRACITDHSFVADQTGKTVDFQEEGMYSRAAPMDIGAARQVLTISLLDLLKKHHAPKYIDYLSIDTEGNEFEIIKDFPFSEYTIQYITIEHNAHNKTPQNIQKRQDIHQTLSAAGYRRLPHQHFSNQYGHTRFEDFEDWYILRRFLGLDKDL